MAFYFVHCFGWSVLGDEQSASFLLKHGADVNMSDARNNTPLHLMLANRNENMLNIAEKLIYQGAHLDAQNQDLM